MNLSGRLSSRTSSQRCTNTCSSAAAFWSSSHGAGLSDGGGNGRPEATCVHSLEVHAKAGSLLSVCGEYDHDFIHLRCSHHDNEFGEKPPGQENETKRQLKSKGPGLCLYCRNGSPHFQRLNPSNFTSTLPRRGDSFNELYTPHWKFKSHEWTVKWKRFHQTAIWWRCWTSSCPNLLPPSQAAAPKEAVPVLVQLLL